MASGEYGLEGDSRKDKQHGYSNAEMKTDRCGPDMGLTDRVQEDKASGWRLHGLQPAIPGSY